MADVSVALKVLRLVDLRVANLEYDLAALLVLKRVANLAEKMADSWAVLWEKSLVASLVARKVFCLVD